MAEFFNRALGGSGLAQSAWQRTLRVRLQLKFASEGFALEADEELDVGSRLYVAQTLADIAGIRFTADCMQRMQSRSDEFFAAPQPFAPADVAEMAIRVKRLVTIGKTRQQFDARLQRELAAAPADEAASERAAVVRQHVTRVAVLFGEHSMRAAPTYVVGGFLLARHALARWRQFCVARGAPAVVQAQRSALLREFWQSDVAAASAALDARRYVKAASASGGAGASDQLEAEVLAGIMYVRGLLARLAAPVASDGDDADATTGQDDEQCDANATAFFQASLYAFDGYDCFCSLGRL